MKVNKKPNRFQKGRKNRKLLWEFFQYGEWWVLGPPQTEKEAKEYAKQHGVTVAPWGTRVNT